MSDPSNPEVSVLAQPDPEQVGFDLDRALSAVLGLRTNVPENALTAPILGTERAGHGILINEQGLVVTVGYLITEADSIWLLDNRGNTFPRARGGFRPGERTRFGAGAAVIGFALLAAWQCRAFGFVRLGDRRFPWWGGACDER